eukprot:scaffold231917_cov31-Tisochrysis_lutea.AAC.3
MVVACSRLAAITRLSIHSSSSRLAGRSCWLPPFLGRPGPDGDESRQTGCGAAAAMAVMGGGASGDCELSSSRTALRKLS